MNTLITVNKKCCCYKVITNNNKLGRQYNQGLLSLRNASINNKAISYSFVCSSVQENTNIHKYDILRSPIRYKNGDTWQLFFINIVHEFIFKLLDL